MASDLPFILYQVHAVFLAEMRYSKLRMCTVYSRSLAMRFDQLKRIYDDTWAPSFVYIVFTVLRTWANINFTRNTIDIPNQTRSVGIIPNLIASRLSLVVTQYDGPTTQTLIYLFDKYIYSSQSRWKGALIVSYEISWVWEVQSFVWMHSICMSYLIDVSIQICMFFYDFVKTYQTAHVR